MTSLMAPVGARSSVAEAVGSGRHVVLIGFMGAGKTTSAKELGEYFGLEVVDSDALIEEELGCSISEWFSKHGEPSFREYEEKVVSRLLGTADSRVIALGGGAIESEGIRKALAPHQVLYLDVDCDTAWERVQGARPLATERAAFEARLVQRRSAYEALADVVFPARLSAQLPEALPLAPENREGVQLLWAASESSHYPVFFGKGALEYAPKDGRYFLLVDSNVDSLLGSALPKSEHKIVVAAGEASKSLTQAELILRELAQKGMRRGDSLIAMGGGVIGDLAGFCGAVYQRGVSVIQIPTTLIGQADSAFGGKTAVDLPEGKNYVGCYHNPKSVLVDPALLETLPKREVAAGWAEVIKTALIAGGHLWEAVRQAPVGLPDEAIIRSCVLVKLGVVERDERDAGLRQQLNLGHTVGHAIEAATNYQSYSHGEAVGLGLLTVLTLSELPELRAEVRELLTAHGLPARLDGGVQIDTLLEIMRRDKKRTGEEVPFVLLDRPGMVRVGCGVEAGALVKALTEVGVDC